jgi:hypothetical protein
MNRLSFGFLFVLAVSPLVLSHDVSVLAEGYSWLENLLPSGMIHPLIFEKRFCISSVLPLYSHFTS